MVELEGEDRHLFPDNDHGAHRAHPLCFCGPAGFPIIHADGLPGWAYIHHFEDVTP